jgi:hypothetical protein
VPLEDDFSICHSKEKLFSLLLSSHGIIIRETTASFVDSIRLHSRFVAEIAFKWRAERGKKAWKFFNLSNHKRVVKNNGMVEQL